MELNAEKRRRMAHALVHGVMSELHAALADCGMTYAAVAEAAGESEEIIRRMFSDLAFVGSSPEAIRLLGAIASVTDRRITLTLDHAEHLAKATGALAATELFMVTKAGAKVALPLQGAQLVHEDYMRARKGNG